MSQDKKDDGSNEGFYEWNCDACEAEIEHQGLCLHCAELQRIKMEDAEYDRRADLAYLRQR